MAFPTNKKEILPWLFSGKRLVVVLILAFVVVLALLWSYKDTIFVPDDPNAYKVLEGENNQLREQNAGLRKQYEDAMVKGQALELERDGLAAELEKFGAKAAEGVQKQKDAADQFQKDIAIIGIDQPVMVRCLRYCDSRAAAGFPCKPSGDSYCRLHYGGQ